MIITQEEFMRRFREGNLHIAFVGMSNIGKSFRSKQLKEKMGFERRSIDHEIGDVLGLTSMNQISKWMGYPFDPQYKKAEKEYLALEEKLTKKPPQKGKNTILDSTGSIIYTSPELLKYIQKKYLVIYLSCPDSLTEKMIGSFFRRIKPVIWGDMFQKKEGETNEEALKRCYPKLLKYRSKKYESLGDITIHGSISRDDNHKYPIKRFFKEIQKALPKEKDFQKNRHSDSEQNREDSQDKISLSDSRKARMTPRRIFQKYKK